MTPPMGIPTILLHDGYKAGHVFQYPADTTLIYSNLTARSSRTPEDHVVAFGFQYFVEEYLVRQFRDTFFGQDKQTVVDYYQRRMDNYLGLGAVPVDHIAALHDLGYLPLCIKAVPEGTRVPLLTIYNTHPDFFWVTNILETLMSNILWGAITSATTAFQYQGRIPLKELTVKVKLTARGARMAGALRTHLMETHKSGTFSPSFDCP